MNQRLEKRLRLMQKRLKDAKYFLKSESSTEWFWADKAFKKYSLKVSYYEGRCKELKFVLKMLKERNGSYTTFCHNFQNGEKNALNLIATSK